MAWCGNLSLKKTNHGLLFVDVDQLCGVVLIRRGRPIAIWHSLPMTNHGVVLIRCGRPIMILCSLM